MATNSAIGDGEAQFLAELPETVRRDERANWPAAQHVTKLDRQIQAFRISRTDHIQQ
jgi:hypothetical protein